MYLHGQDEEGEIWRDFFVMDETIDAPPDVMPERLMDGAYDLFETKIRAGEVALTIMDFPTEGAKTRKSGVAAFPKRLLRLADYVVDLLSFFHDRLKVHLKDQGIRYDIIDACIAMPGNGDLTLLVKRAKALAETLATDDGENLIQGFKRANNILTQAEEKDGVEYSYGADLKFAEDPAEKALFAALDAADAKIKPAMEAEDFTTAMAAMAELRPAVDAFFTDVQVNADSEILRRNRLNLLSRIRTICLSVADLTKIEG